MTTNLQTMILHSLPCMRIVVFGFKFHWNMIPMVQLKSHHWFRWWSGTDQATNHYLNQWWPSLLMYICTTWPICMYEGKKSLLKNEMPFIIVENCINIGKKDHCYHDLWPFALEMVYNISSPHAWIVSVPNMNQICQIDITSHSRQDKN